MLFSALMLGLFALDDPQVVNGVIVRPDWVAFPSGSQLMPPGLRTEYRPQGKVQLLCTVVGEGRLQDCAVTTTPDDYPELGDVALRASRHFQHRLVLEDGRPALGMKVRVSMNWRYPE